MSNENAPMREMTFGEKAVGLTFNPGGSAVVNEIKAKYAEIIDILHNNRHMAQQGAGPGVNEQARMLSIAITDAQTSQMWAVKAVTWQF